MDWDDLRFFLAVVRHKSLAGAARHLRVTQSTVGRRLASLQARLGVRLVQRTTEAGGYVLTLAGETIRAHVERIEDEMRSIERAVSGLDTRLAGTVRLACPSLMASHVLAPCAAALYARHPEIRLELLSHGPVLSDPLEFEADLLIQFRRLERGDFVVRRIGTIAFGLYASLAYLSRHGEPSAEAACADHRIVAMIDETEVPEQAEWLAGVAGRAEVLLRTDNRETLLWTALQGRGLALLPRFRGDGEAALRKVEICPPPPSAEVWLAVHEEVRRLPRVRAVIDAMTDAFHRMARLLEPEAASRSAGDSS